MFRFGLKKFKQTASISRTMNIEKYKIDCSKLKVGDKLWSIQLGDCKMIGRGINAKLERRIVCENINGSEVYYTFTGYQTETDAFPSLFTSNPFMDNTPSVSDRYIVTESDLSGQLKGFPIEVVQRMVDYQVKQGNLADISIFQSTASEEFQFGGFNWDETPEKTNFWHSVIMDREFDRYFEMYPKSAAGRTKTFSYMEENGPIREEAFEKIGTGRRVFPPESILQEAERLINGDRAAQYGDAKENFGDIAKGWSVLFKTHVTAEQVAIAMIWLKMCRFNHKEGRDSIVDIAGYAGCVEKIQKGGLK